MSILESIHTSTPVSYTPPRKADIDRAAQNVGLSNYDDNFLLDLAQRSAGGEIKDESEWRLLACSEAAEKLRGKCATREEEKKAQSERIKYHKNICEFIKTLDLERQPGNTPLTQAASVLKILGQQQGGGEGGGGDSGPDLPIFLDKDGKSLAGQLNDAASMAHELSDAEIELLTVSEDQEDGEDGPGNQGSGPSRMIKLISSLVKNDLVELLKLSRQVDNISNFQARKVVEKLVDREGTDVQNRNVRTFDEMSRMNRTEWSYPKLIRHVRVLQQSAQLRERVKTVTHRQLIYMIVDGSSSMRRKDRIDQASAILMNRLIGVINGDVDLYFSWFTEHLHDVNHIENAKHANKALYLIRESGFPGGGTCIGKSVGTAIERIKAMDGAHKPEIVVVSDGCDSVGIFPKEGIKVHAFIVGTAQNDSLLTAARASGGVAHRLQSIYKK